ncbi:hypothetical protein C8R45DRAFT_918098 [Mycena sanguinolenta]|nr:hypothetical protein C8R45DRAFT_918098 [Mycena sanguinolenta]
MYRRSRGALTVQQCGSCSAGSPSKTFREVSVAVDGGSDRNVFGLQVEDDLEDSVGSWNGRVKFSSRSDRGVESSADPGSSGAVVGMVDAIHDDEGVGGRARRRRDVAVKTVMEGSMRAGHRSHSAAERCVTAVAVKKGELPLLTLPLHIAAAAAKYLCPDDAMMRFERHAINFWSGIRETVLNLRLLNGSELHSGYDLQCLAEDTLVSNTDTTQRVAPTKGNTGVICERTLAARLGRGGWIRRKSSCRNVNVSRDNNIVFYGGEVHVFNVCERRDEDGSEARGGRAVEDCRRDAHGEQNCGEGPGRRGLRLGAKVCFYGSLRALVPVCAPHSVIVLFVARAVLSDLAKSVAATLTITVKLATSTAVTHGYNKVAASGTGGS